MRFIPIARLGGLGNRAPALLRVAASVSVLVSTVCSPHDDERRAAAESMRADWTQRPAVVGVDLAFASETTWAIRLPAALQPAVLEQLPGERQDVLEVDADEIRIVVRVEPRDARLPLPSPSQQRGDGLSFDIAPPGSHAGWQGSADSSGAFVFVEPHEGEVDLLAQALSADAFTRRGFAQNVADWIQANISQEFRPESARSPAAVLRYRAAECLGSAALAAALLRSRGIVARTVAGLAPGKEGTFVFHAWIEYDDGRVVTLDPLRGGHPVPASYLALLGIPHDDAGVLQPEVVASLQEAFAVLEVVEVRRGSSFSSGRP